MRIIIAPAKKMKEQDGVDYVTMPIFLKQAQQLKDHIVRLPFEKQKELWNCNDAIALLNHERFERMNLYSNLSAALLAYDGIQYQSMAPDVFEQQEFDYLQKNLRILSGFYGVLRPLDGIVSYRLEMQSCIDMEGCDNLYQFWKDSLYRQVIDEQRIIVNLASKEYAKCVEDYLCEKDRMITCVFGELVNGKAVQKGVYAKMARGSMVRYMAENKIESVEQLKAFNVDGYTFNPTLSDEDNYVFTR